MHVSFETFQQVIADTYKANPRLRPFCDGDRASNCGGISASIFAAGKLATERGQGAFIRKHHWETAKQRAFQLFAAGAEIFTVRCEIRNFGINVRTSTVERWLGEYRATPGVSRIAKSLRRYTGTPTTGRVSGSDKPIHRNLQDTVPGKL